MSCNIREKHIRANQRNQLVKPDPGQGSTNNNTGNAVERTLLSKSIMESGIKPSNCFMGGHDSAQNTNPSLTPGAGLDSSGWVYCAEEQLKVECPKRFSFSPLMKSSLKRNVATFDALIRSNYKNTQNQSQAASSLLPSGHSESQNSKSQDVVNNVLSRFHYLNLDEGTDHGYPQMDKDDEVIVSLIHQIKDLERQSKEREEWAHQKAIQVARKLIDDLTELEMLRMEREETQSMKKGKRTVEDNTMKKLTEYEIALRKASDDVSRVNSAMIKLEIENAEIRAEIRAEIKAYKLSASESATTSMEVAKMEKKCLQKISALGKQSSKLQEDIAAQKQKYSDLAEQLAQGEADHKKAEEKWFEEQETRKVALTQVEEEQKFKEAAEAGNKRKRGALRLKVEMDFQRLKDDFQRLEQDLAMLKSSELSTGNLLDELDNLENSAEKEVGSDRECILCLKDEVSVVFLPCAHLAVCANCNKSYGKKERAVCPSCCVPIEQRIRVF